MKKVHFNRFRWALLTGVILILAGVLTWRMTSDFDWESGGELSQGKGRIEFGLIEQGNQDLGGEGSVPDEVESLTDEEVATIKAQIRGREKRVPLDELPVAAERLVAFVDSETGREMRYVIALDELSVAGAGEGGKVMEVEKQDSVEALLSWAEQQFPAGDFKVRLVLYPEGGGERRVESRRILTEKILFTWNGETAPAADLEAAGLADWKPLDVAPGQWVASVKAGSGGVQEVLRGLVRVAGLAAVRPVLAQQRVKKSVPNDPLFAQQWHLRNTGQRKGKKGMDANVVPVWAESRGDGVQIGIIDDGVDFAHPDLAPAKAASGHYDWVDDDSNPAPVAEDDDHGTAVAGVAAARGFNGLGVSGAAPSATLVGLRISLEEMEDVVEGMALAHQGGSIWVKNNSWGPPDVPDTLGAMGPMARAAIQQGISTGRGGRGTIYVWAAGNGRGFQDQSNKDAYANHRGTLAVGAVTNVGKQSFYSESGANLVVSASSDGGSAGIVTTDRVGNKGYNRSGVSGELSDRDYTRYFGGTSASSPLVSGVVALMLEVNPDLGWRDVQEILLRSSTRVQSGNSDWTQRHGGRPHLLPIKHHHGFGGGLVNGVEAVAMSDAWVNLAADTMQQEQATYSPARQIPDRGATQFFPFTFSSANRLRVEFVEVEVNLPHSYKGDLEIKLVSPSGVESLLASPTLNDAGFDPDTNSFGVGYEPWTFTSVRHWGEASSGTWELQIRDVFRGDIGNLKSAKIRIYGVPQTLPVLTGVVGDQLLAANSPAVLSVSGTGTEVAFLLKRQGVDFAGSATGDFSLELPVNAAGTFTMSAVNGVGADEGAAFAMGLVEVEDSSRTVNEGKALRLTAVAASPLSLSYQWKLDGVALVEAVDGFRGVQTPTLTVRAVDGRHHGRYECEVSDGVRTLVAGEREVNVLLKPTLLVQSLDDTVVGGAPSYPLVAENEPTRFFARGLPRGMWIDADTGELGGRPIRSGDYRIEVWGRNSAGTGPRQVYFLRVDDLPEKVRGGFRGVVRAVLPEDLDGSVQMTVAASGGLSGRLWLPDGVRRFKGLVAAEPGGTLPVTCALVARGRRLSDVAFEVSIDPLTGVATSTLPAAASLVARHSGWHARQKPATAYEGVFTVALRADTPDAEPSAGFAVLRVARNGGVRLAGRSGLAVAYAGAGVVADDGHLAVYVPLDKKRGLYSGWLRLLESTGPVFLDGTVEQGVGEPLKWFQPSSRLALLPGGIHVDVVVEGAKLQPVNGDGLMLGALPLPGGVNAGVGFESAEVLDSVQWPDLDGLQVELLVRGRVRVPAPLPAALRLQLVPGKGTFSGLFELPVIHPEGGRALMRRCRVFGVLLPGSAVGCFVIARVDAPQPGLPLGVGSVRPGVLTVTPLSP